MSNSLAEPVPARTGVRSMITVTYLSPRRVWRHTCSSTPMTFTPFNRPGSLISTRRPSARTASLAVFHATPSPWADASDAQVLTHDRLQRPGQSTTRQPGPRLGRAAVSWRHTCPHPVHRYRRIVTSRMVGRQPSGSCARDGCPGVFLHTRSVGTSPRCRHRPPGPGTPGPRDRAPDACRPRPGRAHPGGRTWSGQGSRR